jgi:hypothetical protein
VSYVWNKLRRARLKPWGAGRIGKIENRVHTELICARNAISTGELVRKIYCHERWDQNFRLRDKGAKPARPKHWMYERVRLAAATFADRVGRGRGGVYWQLRKDTDYHTIRAQKRKRYKGEARFDNDRISEPVASKHV